VLARLSDEVFGAIRSRELGEEVRAVAQARHRVACLAPNVAPSAPLSDDERDEAAVKVVALEDLVIRQAGFQDDQ
jgi:hypothetical protein